MTALPTTLREREHFTIDSFNIGAFRGLQGVNLKDVGRFNLLVGSGNSGKTSILEALAILSNPISVPGWLSVARSREFRSPILFYDQAQASNIELLSWLFPHLVDGSEPGIDKDAIVLQAAGATPIRELIATTTPLKGTTKQTRYVEDEDGNGQEIIDDIEDTGLSVHLKISYESDELPFDGNIKTLEIETPYWLHAGIPTRRAPSARFRIACEFLAPYSHRNQPHQLRGLSKAVVEDEKASISNLIKDLDPCVRGIEIITDKEGSRPLIALRHCFTGLAPLSVFGDGLRRALTIALAIQQARNGLLLIDEIEAALHVSALNKVFPWIMRACREYNVQLFATTHSLEAVGAISAAAELNDPTALVAFHLGAEIGDQNVKRYSGAMLRRLVHERGLDIR